MTPEEFICNPKRSYRWVREGHDPPAGYSREECEDFEHPVWGKFTLYSTPRITGDPLASS